MSNSNLSGAAAPHSPQQPSIKSKTSSVPSSAFSKSALIKPVPTRDIGDERAVLVGQHRVSFNDVVADTLRSPFNWRSFARVAGQKYGHADAVAFVEDYRGLFRSSANLSRDEVQAVSREWYGKYVKEGAERELTLPQEMRFEVMTLVQGSQDPKMGKPVILELVKLSWEPIYYHCLRVLFEDVFKLWAVDAAVQKDVALSKELALWWRTKPLTLSKFFSFPNPIDKAESRIHGMLVAIMCIGSIMLDYFTGMWYLLLPVFYGLFIRALCGPRLDPQAYMVLFMIRPMVVELLHCLDHEFVPGPPRRFTQAAGAVVVAIAIGCRLLGWNMASWVIAGLCAMFSMIACVFDKCTGCYIFSWLIRLGLVPQKTCEKCKVKYVNTDVSCPDTLESKKIAELDP